MDSRHLLNLPASYLIYQILLNLPDFYYYSIAFFDAFETILEGNRIANTEWTAILLTTVRANDQATIQFVLNNIQNKSDNTIARYPVL